MKRSKMRAKRLPAVNASAESFDISVVLNLHNEARYLKRTLLSLEEAVRYVRPFDVSTELVVVLDNADKPTREMAEGYDYSTFDAVQIIHVQNGSLGLSRNDGIAVSRGEYIATADADDLISFDYLQKMYMTAYSSITPTIVFPEFFFAFGEQSYIWKIFEHRYVGNFFFFDHNPYVSRVVFQRSTWERIKFCDASIKSGYAFEDWHFTCQCLAAGIEINVAKHATVFYRQRVGSLLRQATAGPRKLIPPSQYFEPATFLRICWNEGMGHQLPAPSGTFSVQDYIQSPGVVDVVFAANQIEPAVSLGILQYSHSASNLSATPGPLASAYFQLCRAIAGTSFTDVVLLPFLARGGAEKYIFSVLSAISKLDPEAKILVLTGQANLTTETIELPTNDITIVDLTNLEFDLTLDQICEITFRYIENSDINSRIHSKHCEYADRFLKTYARYLSKNEIYYYYFSNSSANIGGMRFVNGHSFDTVSEAGRNFTALISDNGISRETVSQLVDDDTVEKSKVIYSRCELPVSRRLDTGPTRTILWASRVDTEKRPHLLVQIAKRLQTALPQISILAFGGTAFGMDANAVFDGLSNLSYKGGFTSFEALPASECDLFLYTTSYDGLPIVILEAMAAGLPVIAPEIGGIGEAVSDNTGYLIPNDVDDDILVESYVSAIRSIYDNWDEARRRAANARQLIADRHSESAFVEQVGQVFALGNYSLPRSKPNS